MKVFPYGTNIVFSFRYSFELKEKVKHLFEGQMLFNKLKKHPNCWSVPMSVVSFPAESINKLINFCNAEGFIIHPDLIGQLKDNAENQKNLHFLSSATEIDGDLPIEGLLLEPRPYQKAGIKYMVSAKKCINADSVRMGKFQPVDSKVLTPKGWTEIGSIKVGDLVIGSNGQPTTVTGVFPQGGQDVYRLKFSDHSSVEAGLDHLWTFYYIGQSKGKRKRHYITLTTKEAISRGKIERDWGSGKKRTILDLSKTSLYLPIIEPVVFDLQDKLEIPPYTLGLLIANGSLSSSGVKATVSYIDADEIIDILKSEGTTVTYNTRYANCCHIGLPGLMQKVKSFGLNVTSKDKFIPRKYFTASIADRMSLLYGLMDGDGSISKIDNRVTYHTISFKLAHDIVELVEGLGGIANVRTYDRTKENKPIEYQVRVRMPNGVPNFRVKRKAERQNFTAKTYPRRLFIGAEYSRNTECVCISVAAEDHLYTTEHCILTHNTLQSLAAIHYLQAYPALVVCKSGLMYNWKNEIQKTLGEKSVHITDNVKKGIAENRNFVIINPEKLAKLQDQLKEYKFGSVIYDEAHNIGGSKTAKFNALKEITKEVPYRYALTGTPIKNRALEVVNILDFLGRLKEFGGKWRLINEFYEVRQDFSIGEARDLDKLHAKLKSFCMVRRTAKEVLGEVPDKVYSSVLVELSNYKEYRALSSEIQKLKGVEFVSERKGKLFELKRIVGEGKVDAISQWIEDFLDSGEQLVVFAHHIEVQKRLLTKFPDAAYILGGQSLASREHNKNAFQNKEKQLIICSLMAAGEGLDLSSANTVAICELGWTPPQMEQAIGRIYRVGKTEPMSIYTFIAENTIDIKLASMLQDKGFEGDMTVSGKVEDSYVESLLEELQD